MGLIDRVRNLVRSPTATRLEMISQRGMNVYQWDGKLFQSDAVRACIRPMARAVGKAVGKHVRSNGDRYDINPVPYIRFLLEEPNAYMTGQQLQEKLAWQLALNNNAFAWIQRDAAGLPVAIYPVNCSNAEVLPQGNGQTTLIFNMPDGQHWSADYRDVIHLRNDFLAGEFFGTSPAKALAEVMEVISSTDQSVVNAIKNSAIIRWLLKVQGAIRDEDLTKKAKTFSEMFLQSENNKTGAAAVDGKTDATQVQPQDYVPNAAIMDRNINRLYAFFNTNAKIVTAAYSENEWVSYYETSIEPVIQQLSEQYTIKLFSRRERGVGNKILFASNNLSFASMSTKLALQAAVDRGAMTPNEWRDVLGYGPIDGGDKPLRRLDTATVESQESKEKPADDNDEQADQEPDSGEEARNNDDD